MKRMISKSSVDAMAIGAIMVDTKIDASLPESFLAAELPTAFDTETLRAPKDGLAWECTAKAARRQIQPGPKQRSFRAVWLLEKTQVQKSRR